ncbi:hypothetical protein TrLO_g12763 [Triparma laevis f. longispina]|uniref:Uncharacterized protein n=1 Tax=Triparma laevis f. longispina TaxID=1714387 RepID=A0A9W7AEC4_9STRA|nr:hypothetical protein TrLO_g12763 [Triparma laevis f. longispina]
MSWTRTVGSVSTAASIVAASFGSHGLQKLEGYTPKKQKQWEIANQFHLVNSVALTFLSPLLAKERLALNVAGGLLSVGITGFSGSIYAKVYAGDDKFGKGAPVGGIALILGWLSIAVLRR